jgi:cell shape-determining protein MreD
MLKKSHDVKLRQQKLFVGLFLVSTFFSFINLFSFLNINIYPEYFLALMVLTISSNLISINITKVFLMGVIVDILIGSILGTIHHRIPAFIWPPSFFPEIFFNADKASSNSS